jgi:hypothetical protein
MSWLLGNRERKAAQDGAARAEADRLIALPVPLLAAELMPAFGPGGPRPAGIGASGVNRLQIQIWMMRSYPRGLKYVKELSGPVSESLGGLATAGLVQWIGSGNSGTTGRWWQATRLGETALAQGTVGQYLKQPAEIGADHSS